MLCQRRQLVRIIYLMMNLTYRMVVLKWDRRIEFILVYQYLLLLTFIISMNDYSTLYLLVVLSLLCCICHVLCNIMSLTYQS